MHTLKAKLIDRYQQSSIPQRFYGAALAVYLVGFVLFWKQGFTALYNVSTLGCALIVCGFVSWCYPFLRWLHGAWEKPLAKTPIVILHLLVLLIATACARHAVSESLGLPPQSFDLSVALLALLFYIPAWLGVLAAVILPFAFVGWVVALLGLGLDFIWQQLSGPFNGFGYKPVLKDHLGPVLFHCTGALMGAGLLTASFGYFTENFSPTFKAMTQVIALRSDFHQAPHYPGVQPGEWVHPLENGYIAFARQRDDHSTEFGVRVQATDAPEAVVQTLASPKSTISALFAGLHDTLQQWLPQPPPAN